MEAYIYSDLDLSDIALCNYLADLNLGEGSVMCMTNPSENLPKWQIVMRRSKDFLWQKKAKLSVLAVFCFLLKKKRGVIKDRKSDGLHSDNIAVYLVSNYRGDDPDRLLESCFGFVIRELARIYKQNENTRKLASYSSFLRSDQYYEDNILQSFDNPDSYDQEKIGQFMTVFGV